MCSTAAPPAVVLHSTAKDRNRAVRTFVAIEIEKPILDRIEDIRDVLREADADIKWAERENTHLTLKFIGEIDAAQVEPIKAALQALAARSSPFELAVRGVGSFPKGHPRVIWVGADEPTGALQRLQEGVDETLAGFGVERDDREFSPHLTLGRVRSGRNIRKLMSILESIPAELGNSRVGSFTLFESKLTPRGPTYSALAVIRLG